MGRRRHQKGRVVDGILLLDKPIGESSNHALQSVKRLFNARKAGHTGSLDPLASGLLPICFGHATKMSAFLLEAGKSYRVRCQFGASTDTGDADGVTTATQDTASISEGALRTAIEQFTGEIMQIPPMYSAVHHKGQRLYKLAREGIEVEREARPVNIYELALVSLDGKFAEMEVSCSKGTYIRTLIEDIATAMGNLAHVVALRRTAVGPFQADGMVTLEALQSLADAQNFAAMDALLLGVDSAVGDRPGLQLNNDCADHLAQGQPIRVPEAPAEGQVRLYGANSRFLGMGEVLDDGRVAPRRLFTG